MVKLLGIFFFTALIFQPGYAMDNSAETDNSRFFPEWLTPSDYAYSPEGMADPFTPFIQAVVEEEMLIEPERPPRPLTPLERIEVSQLNLVGILWDEANADDPAAMVELPDGKGFILKMGTVVGKRMGQVVAIMPGQVVVSEMVTNIYGVTEERRITLRLRPGQDD